MVPLRDTSQGASGLRVRLIVLGIWTFMGLLDCAKLYVTDRLEGRSRGFDDLLIFNMPWWYLWALLTPLVVLLAKRFRFDGRRWWLALPVHLPASFLLSTAHLLLTGTLFYYTINRGGEVFRSLGQQVRFWLDAFLFTDVLTYASIVGAYYAVDFYRRLRERELAAAQLETRAAQLEARMTEARLNALRMELNPHFLFNTLNAISGLVRRRENAGAVHMLARLGDLLRVTLDRQSPQEVALEKELEFLRGYLEIEKARFRDRLSVELDLDAESLQALVPTLLLQPLVENAVRHGVAPLPGRGKVRVSARREGSELVLEVRDTGPGLAADRNGTTLEGIGLSNTRGRLQQLYGEGSSIRLENAPEGGAVATVRLPFRREPSTVSMEGE